MAVNSSMVTFGSEETKLDITISADGYISKALTITAGTPIDTVLLDPVNISGSGKSLDEAVKHRPYYTNISELNNKITEIFNEINIASLRTNTEKVYACFKWIMTHIRYEELSAEEKKEAGGGYVKNYWGRANIALKNSHGCCIEYTCILAAMLERLGLYVYIAHDPVGRSGDANRVRTVNTNSTTSGHVWNLVSYAGQESGTYFHYDVQVAQAVIARALNKNYKAAPLVYSDLPQNPPGKRFGDEYTNKSYYIESLDVRDQFIKIYKEYRNKNGEER